MPMKLKTIEVTGRGPFPWDMLRYDSAWPATSEDAAKLEVIAQHCGNVPVDMRPLKIRLLTYANSVTPDRWRSFTWDMVIVP